MTSGPQIPELPSPEELRDRFSRLVAVAIVTATLAAAVVGYLLAVATRAGDAADVRAQRLANEVMGATLRSQELAQVDYEMFLHGQERQRRGAAALQASVFTAGAERRRLELEKQRMDQVAARIYALSAIKPDSTDGPEQDPAFPDRFKARALQEPARLAALQDAANEERALWERQTARYTAILTIFAVALYLLGRSLTVPQMKQVFFAVGVALLAVSLVWTAVVVLTRVRRAPDETASAFAAGQIALDTAIDRDGFLRARDHFTRAIKLRPSFALAYTRRAYATFRADSPETGRTVSLSSTEALASFRKDLLRARELGYENSQLLGWLGFADFLLARQGDRPELMDESIRFTQEAIKQDPGNVFFRYNLGLSLLAKGHRKQALEAYEDAVQRTVYDDPDERTLRDAGSAQSLVTGALTDLEILRAARPELIGEVLRLKERIVGPVSLGSMDPVTSFPRLSGAQLDVYAADLQVSGIDTSSYDPEEDVVSVQWYQQGPQKLGWAVLPEISGVDDLQRDSHGRYFLLRSYLRETKPPRCLQDGQYRVEVYVNGHFAAQAEKTAALGDLRAAVSRELGLGLCHPPGWRPSARSLSGVSEGWTSPTSDRGAYLFRIIAPRRFARLESRQRAAQVLDTTLSRFASLFPSQPMANGAAEEAYFVGADGGLERRYRYRGGQVRAGAGVDDDSSIVIGFIFGPDSYFADHQPDTIFESIVNTQ